MHTKKAYPQLLTITAIDKNNSSYRADLPPSNGQCCKEFMDLRRSHWLGKNGEYWCVLPEGVYINYCPFCGRAL